MDRAGTSPSSYALGHSAQELERLSRQAEVFAPFTRQLLKQAGIRPGMRILDVGCGAGDVTFLAADLVGPTGKVVGTDHATAAVEWARARNQGRQAKNVEFLEGDPTRIEFDGQFDAVVGRFVLMYYPDPIAAIRKLTRHVRSDGLIIFQEFDMDNARTYPPAQTLDRTLAWMRRAFDATGAHTQLGLELFRMFLAAGLTAPLLRVDAIIAGGLQFPCDILVALMRSLLPVMEKLEIASASEVELPTLAERMRNEVVACRGVIRSPAIVGAWSRKPARL